MKEQKTCFIYGGERLEWCDSMKIATTLNTCLLWLVQHGYTHFLIGTYYTFDLMLIVNLVQLRPEYPDITIEVFGARGLGPLQQTDSSRCVYDGITEEADRITLIGDVDHENWYSECIKEMVSRAELSIRFLGRNERPNEFAHGCRLVTDEGMILFAELFS